MLFSRRVAAGGNIGNIGSERNLLLVIYPMIETSEVTINQ